MNYYWNKIIVLLTVLMTVAFVSCGDEGQDEIVLTTNINSSGQIDVASSGGFTGFTITSNSQWEITGNSADWMTVSPEKGNGNTAVTIYYEANKGENSRTAGFSITAGSGDNAKTLNYVMKQAGSNGGGQEQPRLESSTKSISGIAGDGKSGESFWIYSNLKWRISTDSSWITLLTTEGTGDMEIKFDIAANPGNAPRNGEIRVWAVETDEVQDIIITLSQLASGEIPLDPYLSVDPADITDIPQAGAATLSFEVYSNVEWSVTVDSNSASWVSVNTSFGSNDGTVTFSVAENPMYSTRNATLTVADKAGKAASVTFKVTQLGKTDYPVVSGWAETPSCTLTSDTQYVTHYITLNGKSVRNYSLLWDKNEKIAYWVAFPMHSSYTVKNTNRSDAWAYDPKIDKDDQPYLKKSYTGNYSRGHQIASSDRLATSEANKQTFYYTNMTPQVQTFNGGIWNQLEERVRGWICSDTLYVVTGAALNYTGEKKYTTDNSDKKVAIPSHYYKVLLRSKNGNTGKPVSQLSASELICVGFWFEHEKSWSGAKISSQYMMSVSDIEQLTGYTFFPTVPEEVKNTYKASDWGM